MSIVPMPEIKATGSPEFEEIFNEFSRFVYRTAYAVTGRHEDAEDVLQTIFLRLARREIAPDVLKNPKPYLYRSAVNVSLNVIRSRSRAANLRNDALLVKPETVPDSIFDEELCNRLREAIGQLKPEAAEILLLRYTHNHSDAEIARMLGVSRGTIALKLFRLRARLKRLLRTAMGGHI
ncbi:MAG TPA: RNA polymerase sigma factor [Terriglobia bacterium]|nr:RNA polymerase sigma factor [Terriglobia bacterium]